MFEIFISVAFCLLLFVCGMLGYSNHEKATKIDCDLRGSMVLHGVLYDCKRKDPK